MNKWFHRAVGTVGVASGILLLAGGAAQADDGARPAADPQLSGLLDQFFTPAMGGTPGALLSNLTSPASATPSPAVSPARSSVAAAPSPASTPALPVALPAAASSLPSSVLSAAPRGADGGLLATDRLPATPATPARGTNSPAGDVRPGGNDLFLTGLLPDMGSTVPAGQLSPVSHLGMAPTTPSAPPAGERPTVPTTEAAGGDLLPLAGLPVVGKMLPGLPVAGLPVGQPAASTLPAPARAGSALADPAAAGANAAAAGGPGSSDLPAALPVAGVEPVRGADPLAGPVSALPLSADEGPTKGLTRTATALPLGPAGGLTNALPLAGNLTRTLPVASGAGLPLGAAGNLTRTLPLASAGGLTNGLPLAPAGGLTNTLPLASGGGLTNGLPVRSAAGGPGSVDPDQLGAGQALGTLPSGVRPTVRTGSVGTNVPGLGKVGLDSDDRAARSPALIGDAMTALRPDLFGPAATGSTTPTATRPTTAGAPLAGAPVTSAAAAAPTRAFADRSAERPVAGEDVDYV